MKKKIALLISIIILLFCLFNFCTHQNKIKKLPNKAIIYKSSKFSFENEEYSSVSYDDKIFIIYGSIKPKGIFGNISYAFEDCLGYLENNKSIRIYKLKNASSDEWLIEYDINSLMEEPVVLREITTKNKSVLNSVKSYNYNYWR